MIFNAWKAVHAPLPVVRCCFEKVHDSSYETKGN